MRVIVLNGSPKGMNSVTMQYVLFLQKTFPEHEFEITNVCQDLPKLESDEAAFHAIIDKVRSADTVLWAFPLYYLCVHLLDDLAARLVDHATNGYIQPPNFVAVGGQKLFRDAIWASMRVVFQADHRYYRKHGLYDFPSRSLKTRLGQGVLSLMLKIPRFRREFQKRIKDEMVKPLAKVVERCDKR
jgi:hypothetical protein